MAERRRILPKVDRRDFFRLGLAAGPAALAAACGWDGGPVLRPKLEMIGRANDWIGEHLLESGSRAAPEYPVTARTIGQFPAYFVSDDVPMLEQPESWGLEVGGLVGKPVRLTLAQLKALPSVTYTVKHHCVEGWTAVATWTGVRVSAVTRFVEPSAEARYIRFDSFDSGYLNGWDLKSAMHPQTILAYAWNDRPLQPDHGAPLRLYSPAKLGYKLTKYLTAMTFTRERPGGYWEDRGYPWFGGV
jgi:DMSO/TMAO reductase YedYZ molybdopterin-dependent catalytic subunit